MKCIFVIFLFFLVASPCLCATITSYVGRPKPYVLHTFNVVDYGANGTGEIDDSHAFVKAWHDVCYNATYRGTPTLLIPQGKIFMLQPVSFAGPCIHAPVHIEIQGTIIAPNCTEAWKWPTNDTNKWVNFANISGIVIKGGGVIDAQGAPWWNATTHRPTALHFHNIGNLTLSNLTHLNSPKNHISINVCNNSHISDLHISAPGESPNTDGIDISGSSNITILNSRIETGDDCIAINGGCSFINISGIACGPGHGISVGSLGRNGAYDKVEEIHVNNCTFNGTQNGARIKSWVGGSGYARSITYENILLINSKHPLIIDQQYNPHGIDHNKTHKALAVNVSDVTYRNIIGTSASEDAIQLNCDVNIGCTGIVMENINITAGYSYGVDIYASCTKANGTCSSCFPNVPCLSSGYGVLAGIGVPPLGA